MLFARFLLSFLAMSSFDGRERVEAVYVRLLPLSAPLLVAGSISDDAEVRFRSRRALAKSPFWRAVGDVAGSPAGALGMFQPAQPVVPKAESAAEVRAAVAVARLLGAIREDDFVPKEVRLFCWEQMEPVRQTLPKR